VTASNATRKARGARTQTLVAQWFAARGWPFAESTGAGRTGSDVTNMPGLAPEVKARTGFSPLAWIKQARAGGPGLAFVVFRCNGQGEQAIADWPVLVRLEDFTRLLGRSGYGSPECTRDADCPVPGHPDDPHYTCGLDPFEAKAENDAAAAREDIY
jgi:hypothetical protein